MRVVLAPDKFKGSLDARGVAEAVARGIRTARPDVDTVILPAADGGEGTVDAAVSGGWEAMTTNAAGPLGGEVTAIFALDRDQGAALIEMASASGLDLLPRDADGALIKDALRATSRGTGDLLRAALDAGARRIVLAVGGSACTDGGAGMLAALGARLLDAAGGDVPDGGGALTDLDHLDLSGLDPRLADCEITLAADVDNPLLGERGAAAVFGPQKGASPADVTTLETGLHRWRDALAGARGEDALAAAQTPGAGAAGGVGYAALAAFGADMRPGAEVVLELVGLDEQLAGADLVVTGEGSLDEQSLGGKTPMGVARAARRAGVPVVAVAGRTTLDRDVLEEAGFVATYPLTDLEPDVQRCISDAASLLERIGERIGHDHLQD